MICTGVNGTVRKSVNPKAGVNGAVRTVQKGFCGVNGVVRQFFGPLEGLQRVESYFSYAMVYDVNTSTWALDYNTGKSISKSEIAQHGALTMTSSSVTLSCSTVGKIIYLYLMGNAVFSNGRKMDLRSLVNQYPLTLSWPIVLRISGGSGAIGAVIGGTQQINGTMYQNTNYSKTITALDSYRNLFEICAMPKSNSISFQLTFSTITLGGVSYPVTVVTN